MPLGQKSERYTVVLLVLAIHAAVVMILLARSRYRIGSTATYPLEVINLPPERPKDLPLPPAFSVKLGRVEPLSASEPLSLVLPTPPSPERAEHGMIDWTAEAGRQAESSAAVIAAASPHKEPKPSEGANWFPRPLHHKGEEIPSSNGETLVFINDHCYQVTSVFQSAPNALHNGMGAQTYCLGDSGQVRGDLFQDLRAYKKLHPDR